MSVRRKLLRKMLKNNGYALDRCTTCGRYNAKIIETPKGRVKHCLTCGKEW